MPQSNNWIVLRGLARGVGHWGSFVDRMKQRFPKDRLELIDLPGNGARNNELSPLKIFEYVDDLRSHSQFIKNREPVKILAVSLGAMITVEWMHRYPNEITKAYLVCTSSSNYSSFYKRFLPLNYFMAAQMLSKKGIEKEKIILKMVTNNLYRREAELKALSDYSEKYPLRIQNIIRQLYAASRYNFPKKAPGDIKLIGSYGDRLVSAQCTLEIAERWNLKPVMHPWAGHDVAIDDPDWLLEQLL